RPSSRRRLRRERRLPPTAGIAAGPDARRAAAGHHRVEASYRKLRSTAPRQDRVQKAGDAGLYAIVSTISAWMIPALIAFIPLYAAYRKVPVYESFVEGAKDGFGTAVGLIPHLVG